MADGHRLLGICHGLKILQAIVTRGADRGTQLAGLGNGGGIDHTDAGGTHIEGGGIAGDDQLNQRWNDDEETHAQIAEQQQKLLAQYGSQALTIPPAGASRRVC